MARPEHCRDHLKLSALLQGGHTRCWELKGLHWRQRSFRELLERLSCNFGYFWPHRTRNKAALEMWKKRPLLVRRLACGCAALRAGTELFSEKCGAQADAHFGNEVWEADSCLAAGHERRMSLEARAQNLSNLQWLLQGTKAASFLQIPAGLFFQQEEQVPLGFF